MATALPSRPLPAAGPTWQPQDGEVATALGEARALPNTRAPQALVVEHGRHRVVVQVLGAPLVHACRCDDASYS